VEGGGWGVRGGITDEELEMERLFSCEGLESLLMRSLKRSVLSPLMKSFLA